MALTADHMRDLEALARDAARVGGVRSAGRLLPGAAPAGKGAIQASFLDAMIKHTSPGQRYHVKTTVEAPDVTITVRTYPQGQAPPRTAPAPPPASGIKRKLDDTAPAPRAQPKKLTKLLPEVLLGTETLSSQPYEFQLVERRRSYAADVVDFIGRKGYTRKILVVQAETYGEALDVASAEGYEKCSCNGCCNMLPEEDWEFCGMHYECCRCGDAVDIDGEDYCSDCLHVMP